MKFSIVTIFFLSSSLANAQWWGDNGMMDWGEMGDMGGMGHGADCAVSCFTSIYPSHSSDWDRGCATPTALVNCMSSACSGVASAHSITGIQSSMCSVYSSCSSGVQSQDAHTECSHWGFFGPCDGGWDGEHSMGWYTITGTAGQTTGWATTTQTVTTTLSGGSVIKSTAVKTATIVAAAVIDTGTAGGTTTATTTSSPSAITSTSSTTTKSSGASMGLGSTTNTLGALIMAGLSVMIAL